MSSGKYADHTGKTFGRLFVERVSKESRTWWECRCSCGNRKTVRSICLVQGYTRSCGCWHRESAGLRAFKHGYNVKGQVRPEYRIWRGIINRCENPNEVPYHRYGGRGIRMYPEWRASFIVFLEAVGHRPTPKHTIERIDNDGHYEPGNVRWATRQEQARNRSSTRTVVYQGREMSLAEVADLAGVNYKSLWSRMFGRSKALSLEEALEKGRVRSYGRKRMGRPTRGNRLSRA